MSTGVDERARVRSADFESLHARTLLCSIRGSVTTRSAADADTSVYLGRRHIPVASSLAVIQFSFQAFDLVATVALPALQKPEMIVHHAVVAFCAWQVFDRDIMHEPALFFLGTCEMQSLPLTLIDFWTAIPPTEGSYQATAFELTKYIFGALFFYSRIYLWVTKGLNMPS